MSSESNFFAAPYSHKIVEVDAETPAIIEYFDERGKNVTPNPFHIPDVKDEGPRKDSTRKLMMPPKKHPILRTFLHVTTALYSMAGLGSLQESKRFKEINTQRDPELARDAQDPKRVVDVATNNNGREKKLDVKLQPSLNQTRDEGSMDPLQSAVISNVIDILLVESDTIWMLDLPGTCMEIDPDAKTDQTAKKNSTDDAVEAKEPEASKAQKKSTARYELVESWTQTLDFSKKKKGTQCDDIETGIVTTQVSTKDFLDEERRRAKAMKLEAD